MGLKPAGDSGGFFQWVPVFARVLDSMSAITVGGSTFHGVTDFTATMAENSKTMASVGTIFGGVANDTDDVLIPDSVRGKVLVVEAGGAAGQPVSMNLANLGHRVVVDKQQASPFDRCVQ